MAMRGGGAVAFGVGGVRLVKISERLERAAVNMLVRAESSPAYE